MRKINGRHLNIIEQGPADGPAVVLLHHGLGSARAWRKQIPALAAAGWHVVAYDRWGYGKSDPRPAFQMPAFEDDQQDLLGVLDMLGIEQAALVGHSDGATIALHYAAKYFHRVKCLVSIAAHVYIEPKMIDAIQKIRHGFETDADFRQRFQRTHGEKYQSVFLNWYAGWRRPEIMDWDMRPLLAKITCPTLVVQGLEDEDGSPQHARNVAAAIPGAGLWLLPGVGHSLPLDAHEALNRRLLEFLGLNHPAPVGA